MRPFALLGLLCALGCFVLPVQGDEVDDLVSKLRSKDTEARADACEALGKLGAKAKSAVPALEYAVSKDASRFVRRAALQALAEMGPTARSSTAAVLAVFKDNADLRPEAGKTLARIGGATAVPSLKGIVDKKTNDAALRIAAATTLGDFGPEAKTAVKTLRSLLAENDAALKQAGVVALGRIGPDARDVLPELVELTEAKDPALQLAAIEAVGRMGADSKLALRALSNLADNGDSQVAVTAVEGLARVGKNAGPTLAAALKKGDLNRRLLILRAMVAAKMDARGAVAELLVLAGDEQPDVRKLARTLLDTLGKGAASDLIKVLKDPAQPEATRTAAAAALARLEPAKENLADLVRLLKEPKVELRRAAADTLPRLGPDAVDALTDLIVALRDEDAAVRAGAGRAIKNTGPKGAARLKAILAQGPEAAAKAHLNLALRLIEIGSKETPVADLIAALGDKEDLVARAAGEALGARGEPVVPPLVQALKDPAVRRYAALALRDIGPKAKAATPVLVETLADADAPTRGLAAQALAAIGPDARPAAAALINGMLKDTDKEHRAHCARALLLVDPEPRLAAPAFRQALRDRQAPGVVDSAVEGLTKLAAVAELSDALKDKDEEVRRSAVEVLGTLGPAARPAIPALQEATRDGNAQVAAAARHVLEKLFSTRLLQQLNDLRTKSNRPPLNAHPLFMRVAQEHARLMAKEKRTDVNPPKAPAEQIRDAGRYDAISLRRIPARELNADAVYDMLVNVQMSVEALLAPDMDIGIGAAADDANSYYIAILHASKAAPPK